METQKSPVSKSRVLEEIISYLNGEIAEAQQAGDEEQAREMNRLLVLYRFLPKRTYSETDVIIPSALVELKLAGTSAFYFIAPQGGGLIMRVDGRPVQVITPQSPLGEVLLGKRVGDRVQVDMRGTVREYEVVGLS